MRFALVQRSSTTISIKLARSIEELLQLTFDLNPHSSLPHIHQVDPRYCDGWKSTKLVEKIEEQTRLRQFKVLRLPR